MHWLTDPQTWIALITLTALEIVLGIDNIVFISILGGQAARRAASRARAASASALAMVMRILPAPVAHLDHAPHRAALRPLFGHEISGRDLILLAGGLFLIAKSTLEIHDKLEGERRARAGRGASAVVRERASCRSCCSTSSSRSTR